MRKKLKNYIEDLENELRNKKRNPELAQDVLTNIMFFQHERLVHLIVTVFVGIIAILFFLAALYFENLAMLVLFLLLLCLFIPYIFHYYFLENNVQKLYNLYEQAKLK